MGEQRGRALVLGRQRGVRQPERAVRLPIHWPLASIAPVAPRFPDSSRLHPTALLSVPR